jgi:hypothetical protein
MDERDRTRMDLHPMDDPAPVAPYVADEEVVDPRAGRYRVVRRVCAVITIVTTVFAVVLGLHVLLVVADANQKNGFASFIDSFASAVSLGFRGLFTPSSEKARVLLNDGVAAIAWLLIGAVLTYAIRQFALPGPRDAVRYRRTVR